MHLSKILANIYTNQYREEGKLTQPIFYRTMKKNIHPQYFKNATQKCACGAVFHIPCTKKEIEIEICSQCHPFYTGKAKIVDTAGQVEKFERRAKRAKEIKKKPTKKVKKRKSGRKS